ncbi:hypothetical protein L7F22_039209 [Adiantum nelumboides]|nr:hypothetical protein [Adiantum nelumboides]
MRVNIHVPNQQSQATASSSSSSLDLSHMPLPLVRLGPSNELVMIELQGSLEIDDADPKGGQILGKIEFHNGREDRPTLLISHHRLEGKIVSLTKPLAVLEKKQRNTSIINQEEGVLKNADLNRKAADIPSSSPTRFDKQTSAPHISLNDKPGDIPSSPTPVPLQLGDLDQPTSPTFSRKRAHNGAERISTAKKNESLNIPSSSPIPMKRVQGSEIDYSSPLPASKRRVTESGLDTKYASAQEADADANIDEDGWLYGKDQTATYMEVVCIIRKKILFSKRPEPVVRLDTEGGEEAKVALGLV